MPIPEDHRAFLTETRALAQDSSGREVLVGLTFEETEEYLKLSDDRLEGRFKDHSAMLDRLVELGDKHEHMRRQVAVAEAQARRSGPKH